MEAQPGPAKDRDAAPVGPSSPAAGAGGSNRLLAGYLAHEFLTRGTVLGNRLGTGPDTGSGAGQGRAAQYEAVAVLVQGGGARVPGVVNPAQLAAWSRR